ncbi:unnamed protein product [Parajaminaea phylloscopi]
MMIAASARSFHSLFAACALFLTLFAACASAIDRISTQGKYLVRPNGQRFFIRGLAYQESAPTVTSDQNDEAGGFPEPDTFVDPLSLPANCTRDVANMKDLGVNTVRVYSVNSSLNHDACMKTFSDAGIYVIIDLGLPLNGSINRASPSWDTALQTLFIDTIDAFSGYDNLLAVGVGNEVVSTDGTTNAAPFVKAAARDIKAYLKSKGKENILVAYSGADAPSGPQGRRQLLADYLACGSDEVSIDLYGHNTYAWCGNSSLAGSGYDELAQEFADYPIPVYFSEFGCVPEQNPDVRPWTEVSALFSPPMTNAFSGGIAFTYFQKDPAASGKDYGLTTTSSSGAITLRSDWAALKAQYAATSNVSTVVPSNGTNVPYPACNTSPPSSFQASATLPPTPDVNLCSCFESKAWPCVANDIPKNSPAVLGTLLDQACGYIGNVGGSCDPLTADGASGTYGNVSACSPLYRLDWAFSHFYALTQNNAASCGFAGNATLRTGFPTGGALTQEYRTCLANNPVGTKIPVSADAATRTINGNANNGNRTASNNNQTGSSNGSSSSRRSWLNGAAVVGTAAGLATLAVALLSAGL